MKQKEQILSTFKLNYKPCFLLAWLRFLTYSEMENLDLLEPYDAALIAKQVITSKDWDNLVVQYNMQNLLLGLAILMRKLNNTIISEKWAICSIYANDVKTWLYILDDEEFDFDDTLEPEKIKSYYKNIAQKYKIDF